jgi:hypothetical protein
MDWTAAIDESGNDGTSSVVTMAALIANGSHWIGYDGEWRRLLKEQGLGEIHIWKLRNAFKRDPAKLNQIMTEVEKILLQTIAVSVIVVMRKDDYEEIYKPVQPRGGQKRSQLGVLYQALLSFITCM